MRHGGNVRRRYLNIALATCVAGSIAPAFFQGPLLLPKMSEYKKPIFLKACRLGY
jgi:hypothetical protein